MLPLLSSRTWGRLLSVSYGQGRPLHIAQGWGGLICQPPSDLRCSFSLFSLLLWLQGQPLLHPEPQTKHPHLSTDTSSQYWHHCQPLPETFPDWKHKGRALLGLTLNPSCLAHSTRGGDTEVHPAQPVHAVGTQRCIQHTWWGHRSAPSIAGTRGGDPEVHWMTSEIKML